VPYGLRSYNGRMSRGFAAVILMTTLAVGALGTFSSCMSAYKQSVGGDLDEEFSRIFLADMNSCWQAALDALKSVPLETANRESGYIQTKWVDNTADKNFTESFGAGEFYLKAQYRFTMTLGAGFYNGRPSVKITVRKEQLVQQDVLEGWKPVANPNSLEERTLLYRIGQVIVIMQKLADLEDARTKREIEKAKRQL